MKECNPVNDLCKEESTSFLRCFGPDKQFVDYTISSVHWHPWYHCILQFFPRPFVPKNNYPCKNTPPNAGDQAWPRLCNCLFLSQTVYRSAECIYHPIVHYIMVVECACENIPISDWEKSGSKLMSYSSSGLRFSNFGENSTMTVSNRFLTTWPFGAFLRSNGVNATSESTYGHLWRQRLFFINNCSAKLQRARAAKQEREKKRLKRQRRSKERKDC